MRKDCKAYVRSCHKYQIVNQRTVKAYDLLQQLPILSTIWEIVYADHIICLPQTRNGNTNMLVQIDHATRNNKQIFDLHRRSHSFKAKDLALYDWPKQGDHKLSPIFKGPFMFVRPVGAECYDIKSTTQQNKFIKVVHVHPRPYFKRNSSTFEENSTDEENESQ
ncbi:uncharacterized protein TNCV_3795881 [Trichonephila clavipes]|nr:uncharacterized protein TNCV_3795881 [Trichonephila clavipes]